MQPLEESDLGWQLVSLVAATAACLLVVSAVVVGIAFLIRHLFLKWRFVASGNARSAGQALAASGYTAGEARSSAGRVAFLGPLIAFLGLATLLAWGMNRDPAAIPSALIGKPVPEFTLPPVKGRKLGLASADLDGEVSLVNVFASWCTACREEHPVFMQLQAVGVVPIHGLDYKDQPDDAARWLNNMGDPYMRTGADLDGRAAIEWGVYGVPETFVITRDGRIAHKHIGAVTPAALRDTIMPLIRKLQQQ
jgi:cytochrome c biogenesis protein CcmG/thiol:disulfide interchange protein DsbE